jgi:hypothetical protein
MGFDAVPISQNSSAGGDRVCLGHNPGSASGRTVQSHAAIV